VRLPRTNNKGAGVTEDLTVEEARSIIIKPHITEKTFNLIETQNMLIFIVSRAATKDQIRSALKTLYEAEVHDVNTLRTTSGKKAIVKFTDQEGARDLATTMGLV
jgi:large subunit ribosomal protein L23